MCVHQYWMNLNEPKTSEIVFDNKESIFYLVKEQTKNSFNRLEWVSVSEMIIFVSLSTTEANNI